MTPLQQLHNKIGVDPDGGFGPMTLKAVRDFFKLTNEQVAHFCGQVAHETGGFALFSENLNYSASGLLAVFPRFFTADLANAYARQPIKIASRVYANRLGNGDEASQEGWMFRGRGALQTTGKANYQTLSNHLQVPAIMSNPDLVASAYAFESAMFFFDSNNLWAIADQGVNPNTILAMTKRINGGTNGLDDRTSLTNRYYGWLTT